jgi:PEP-CTERM motif
MRAIFVISTATLALLALSAPPAAAAVITYDFSGIFDHGPFSDPTNNTITGQFTLDTDTRTITGFNFQTPVATVSPGPWIAHLFEYTPAVNPADNFVQLAINNEDAQSRLWLLFRTTLAAFDGNTFYTGLVEVDGGGTGSGFSYGGSFGSPFTSGAATPHTTPPNDPPATVPEPTSLMLVGSGLGMFIVRRRGTRSLR